MENLMPPLVVEMLQAIEKVFAEQEIDCYIVGALARDLQLAKIRGQVSSRKSKDIDLAIMVPSAVKFEELKTALIATGHFTTHPTIAIKVFYRENLEVDLLPFGGIESESREVTLLQPRVFRMDMPGFSEVAEFVEHTPVGQSVFKTCSVEGLILLKLYAWNDRSNRTKDLSDIDELIVAYIDLNDRVYEDHFEVLELYDEKELNYLELVSGRIIGRIIAIILGNDTNKIHSVMHILKKRPVPAWAEIEKGLSE
jgi:predicted nucleotidyltransferase